jgi:glutathione S-transferase
MGSTDEEAAMIDCIGENVADINSEFRKINNLADDAKVLALSKWYSEDLGVWLGKLEKSLTSHKAEYAVGESTSLADIRIWHLLNGVFKHDDVVDCVKAHAKLVAINAKITSSAALKKWLEERPVTDW